MDDLENKAYKNGFPVNEEFLQNCKDDFEMMFPDFNLEEELQRYLEFV